jgi:hypothetical protein
LAAWCYIGSTGAGIPAIGTERTGEDCNNQQIVGVPGLNGQVYQYARIDAALNQFEANYANAVAGGQAIPLAWDSAANPGSAPPSDTYLSPSYQSNEYYA